MGKNVLEIYILLEETWAILIKYVKKALQKFAKSVVLDMKLGFQTSVDLHVSIKKLLPQEFT